GEHGHRRLGLLRPAAGLCLNKEGAQTGGGVGWNGKWDSAVRRGSRTVAGRSPEAAGRRSRGTAGRSRGTAGAVITSRGCGRTAAAITANGRDRAGGSATVTGR